MRRTFRSIALGAALLGPAVAWAQPPASGAPTAEQMEAAKKAFEEGNALYKAGKLGAAIEKVKESYQLSRNPFLLFNIGRIYDQLGQKEYALHYYRRFLAEAAANAPMRPDVTKRVAELEKAKVVEANPDEEARQPAVTTPTGKPAIAIGHQAVESSPPNVPIEIVATLPSGTRDVTVMLQFRGSGDEEFTAVPMTAGASGWAAQIPAASVRGNYLQYYLEAKDGSGAVVGRVGKRTSPNLINIEGAAVGNVGLEFDPLSEKRRRFGEEERDVEKPRPPYFMESWISTAVAGAVFGTTVVMYVLASRQSDRLRDDSTSCGTPPCTPFDKNFDARLETLGERYNTAYQISLGLTVASAGVAGYFWYRRMTNKPADTSTATTVVTPVVGDGFAGLATTRRF